MIAKRAAVFLVAASCATVPRAADEGGAPWFRAEGKHVVVETNLGADDARELVTKIENWRLAMTAAVFSEARPPRQQLQVIVLRNRELSALHPTLLGLYFDKAYVGPVLLLGASESSDRSAIMKHELAHAIIDANFHDVPEWLDEGLARTLETTELDEQTGVVRWGRLRGIMGNEIAAPLKPSSRVLNRSGWSASERGNLTYSASYMVHMLMRVYPDEFSCFLGSLAELEGYDKALRECFEGHTDWGREYTHELTEASGHLGEAHIRLRAREAHVVPMGDAQVHAVLGLINDQVARMRVSTEGAAELRRASVDHLRRARALEPTNVLAASLELTESADLSPSSGAYKGLSARLAQEHPGDWRAWCWRAMDEDAPAEDRKAAVQHAAEIAPLRPEVLILQSSFALSAGDVAAAETFARRQLAIAPGYTGGRVVLFLALEQQGRCNEIKALVASDQAFATEARQYLAKYGAEQKRPIHCFDL